MDVKNDILNAAIELFSKRGFEGVSIREVADHAKVHFSSVRYHFGNKESLYNACISKHGESRLSSAQNFLSAEPKSREDMRLRLGYAIGDVFRIHNENPFLTKLILLEVESTSHRSDVVLKKTMVAMASTYAAFFKTGQEKKFMDRNLNPYFITQSLMGVLHHFIRTEPIRERLHSQKTLKDKELLVDNVVTLFLGKK